MASDNYGLDEAGLAAFARDFLTHYRRAGFGRLPKREVDVLVVHLLERYADGVSSRSDTELACEFGTTPSRVRGWRTDARYLYWTNDEQLARVRESVFGAIANDAYRTETDSVIVEVYDPFVKQQVIDILRRHHQLHDTSFNSSLLKLSRDAFWLLVSVTLSDEQVEALLKDEAFREAIDRQSLVDKLRNMTTRKANDLAASGGKEAVKQAAKLAIGAAML